MYNYDAIGSYERSGYFCQVSPGVGGCTIARRWLAALDPVAAGLIMTDCCPCCCCNDRAQARASSSQCWTTSLRQPAHWHSLRRYARRLSDGSYMGMRSQAICGHDVAGRAQGSRLQLDFMPDVVFACHARRTL